MSTSFRFNHAALQFSVDDVPAAVAFYLEVLDFRLDFQDGDPPVYAVVCRDEVYIHLTRPGHPAFTGGPGSAFIAVSGLGPLRERVQAAAPASVRAPLTVQDYGQGIRFRVLVLADPAGNLLRIGEPLPPDDSITGSGHEIPPAAEG